MPQTMATIKQSRCLQMAMLYLFSRETGHTAILKKLIRKRKKRILYSFKDAFTDEMIQDGRTAEQINSSIRVTTGNYYAINAKVSEEQQKQAVEFLKWMEKEENVQKMDYR